MTGDLSTADHDLALQLHMSLEQVLALSNREVVSWRAYMKMRAARQEVGA